MGLIKPAFAVEKFRGPAKDDGSEILNQLYIEGVVKILLFGS